MPTDLAARTVTFEIVRTVLTRAKDDGPGTFIGHASVFNSRTAIGNPKTWGWWEEIDEQAFDAALGRPDDVRFLRDHDSSKLLGRTAPGTLRLSTDKKGLVVEADLPDTELGRDTRVALDRGDLSGMSFGFVPTVVEWSTLDDDTELARIMDIDPLLEVSVVAFPAYPETDAAGRARLEQFRGTNPIRARRHQEALQRFRGLTPPPGATRKGTI